MKDVILSKIPRAFENLTNRELEVLIWISNGMSNKEIAANLNITERTVKNHASCIYKKIGVADRTQAALFAIKNGVEAIDMKGK